MTIAEHQTFAIYLQLEVYFWRSLGLVERQKNANDSARFYAAMSAGSKMVNGRVPSRREDCATSWQLFLSASGVMMGTSIPPFFNSILAIQPGCDVARNLIEYNALQTFTENNLLMSLVS